VLKPNWNPDPRTLRQFAALWLLFLFLAGLLRAWRGGAFQGGSAFAMQGPWVVPIVMWGLALAIGVPALVAPRFVRPIYVGLMALTFPIGWAVSHLLLAFVYFGLFAGLGLAFRLLGRDRLGMRFDRRATTYWKDRLTRPNARQYFRLS
jgi:hypothetical protein